MMKTLRTVSITLIVLAVMGAAVVHSGTFNIAADDAHSGFTAQALETLRERSIARQAKGVSTPNNLDDAELIANGASEYHEMCTACHLAPGMGNTELRQGLYPLPPALAEHGGDRTPAEQFWIIKHGLKMTGMPAWGLTHDDDRLWSLVAFLRKLPGLAPAQYQELVAAGAGGHSHDHGAHDHDAPTTSASLPAEAAGAAAIVDQFQKFLVQGRTPEASALLDPNVLIFEGGGAERSREEYASHHLKSDAQFMKTANVAVGSRRGNVVGDLAWITTESRITTQGARPLDLMSTETMVLTRTAPGWRIAHIHWSSKPAQ